MFILPKEILNLYIVEKISNLAPKIRNLVPESILDSENVNNFKSKIYFSNFESCP